MTGLRREVVGRAAGRVLEVGAGTGLNIPHYGNGVPELVLTEPEPTMARRLEGRAGHAHLSATVLAVFAERLPFDNASFDNVVVTLVPCTVANPSAALQEARRVLVAGGRLLFIEHVRATAGSALERWQHRLHHPGARSPLAAAAIRTRCACWTKPDSRRPEPARNDGAGCRRSFSRWCTAPRWWFRGRRDGPSTHRHSAAAGTTELAAVAKPRAGIEPRHAGRAS